MQAAVTDCVVALLSALSASGIISVTQMAKGFSRIKCRLDEEAIDFGPLAKETFARIVTAGTQAGWLALDPEA